MCVYRKREGVGWGRERERPKWTVAVVQSSRLRGVQTPTL